MDIDLLEHLRRRREQGPVKVADQHRSGAAYARFNARLAVRTTAAVGSMTCAYLFTVIACISLPAAIFSHNVIVMVSWFAQTLVQLVLLSVIMVGQDVQGRAADKRAEQTYQDAEAILHGLQATQVHLDGQDAHLLRQDGRLDELVTATGGALHELTDLVSSLHARLDAMQRRADPPGDEVKTG